MKAKHTLLLLALVLSLLLSLAACGAKSMAEGGLSGSNDAAYPAAEAEAPQEQSSASDPLLLTEHQQAYAA